MYNQKEEYWIIWQLYFSFLKNDYVVFNNGSPLYILDSHKGVSAWRSNLILKDSKIDNIIYAGTKTYAEDS